MPLRTFLCILTRGALLFLLLFSVIPTYANYDAGTWEEECSTEEPGVEIDNPEVVDNATCNVTYTRDGTLTVVKQCHNDPKDGPCHEHRSECVLGEPYISNIDYASCVPTYACSDTDTVSREHAHVLVDTELPPKINEVFYLDNNYNYSLVWDIAADKYSPADIVRTNTAAGCEYTCDDTFIKATNDADGIIKCRLAICLPNPLHGITTNDTTPANSHPFSNNELAASGVLVRDYTTEIKWEIADGKHDVADITRPETLNGCEFTCDDGFIKANDNGIINCRRARCLPNSTIGVTTTDTAPDHAHPLSLDEIGVTGKLVRDYQTVLVDPGVNGTPTQDPTKGCEYTCDNGYRMVTEGGITKCIPNVCIETTTNKKASNGSICQDNTVSNGTQATATSNAAGTVATIGVAGTTYVTAPYVTVSGGLCTVKPVATSTIASGSVTAVTLTGAVGCTVAPTLIIARPNSDDTEYISLHADKPYLNVAMNGSTPNCTSQNKCEWYCPTTTPYYCGVTNTCVARAVDCCPTGQSYCATTNSCATTCASCATGAPSELKAGVDQPYISCGAIDNTNTHFRYKISSGGATSTATATASLGASSVVVTVTSAGAGYTTAPAVTFSGGSCTVAPQATATVVSGSVTAITVTAGTCTIAPTSVIIAAPPASASTYISPNTYTTGTQVKHPFALDAGTYTVTCLYGSSSTPAENMTANAASCSKTMTVTANSTKGCSSIIGYRGNTLSNEMTSNTAFNASFRCGSRSAIPAGTIEPYHLRVGSQLARLEDDAAFLAIFGGGLGAISTQTQQYPFVTNNTAVECAVKVGDGYSTNNSCKITTCVGLDCVTPETFVITHSTEAICTPNTDTTYDIGCNDQSPDYTACVNWLYSGFSGSNSFTRTLDVKINGVAATRDVTCTISRPAGALNDIKNCTLLLPTGNVPVTVFGGENNVFQTTRYTLERDTQAPSASIAYYAKNGNGVPLTNLEYWQNQPATAVITCTDAPGASDGTNCACATTLDGDTDALWSIGVPNTDASIGTRGPDIMKYSRTITSSGPFSAVKVQDTAGLKSSVPINIDIKIDSIAPKVVPSSNGTSVTLVLTDTGGSGLWKPLTSYTQNASAGIASGAVLYKTGSKTDASVPFASETCIARNNADYYKINEASSSAQTVQLAVSGVTNDINTTTAVLAYCVQDNAGNVTRGVYPSTPVACFSASNMPTVPKLSLTNNYIAPLIARITSATPQYGYGMSEDTNTANCFRGIISSNISRLVTSQYNSSLLTASANNIDWNTPAKIKTNPTIANTNGYYYYTTNNGTNNTTLTINSSPAGRGTKTVVAEGANIHITNNINYLDEGDSTKILILIAKKNPTTGTGGNISIDPSVTNIDAILIADGSLLNGTATATPSVITALDWLTPSETNLISNRLTINGRLYSMNTRGGSLTATTGGTILSAIAPGAGKYFNPANSQLETPSTTNLAAEQDLERFRYINDDGTAQCTLHINYKTIPVNELPEILVKSGDYSGCNF